MAEPTALTLTRHLPVKLDDYRKVALGHEEATQHEEIQRLENYLKRVSDSVKEQIKEAQRKENIAARAIVQGFEMKEVACQERRDLDTNSVQVIRLDTKEVVEERAMTADERKVALAQERRQEGEATMKQYTLKEPSGAAQPGL